MCLEAVLKPLLECNLGIEYGKARQAALLLYGYVRANYQDGYLHGQVAGFVLTLPILVERLPALAQYLKADRLFALLNKNNKLAGGGERLRQLLKSAEGGQDNLTRSLRQLQKEHPEQFADEFVEHWDDGRRNAPGSGEPVENIPSTDLSWINTLANVLPPGAEAKITTWIDQGLNAKKLKAAFENTPNKIQLFSDLEGALSKYHRKVIAKDFNEFPGLSRADRVDNSYPNGYVLQNTEVKLPDGAYDPDFSVSYAGDVMSFVKETAELVKLPAGTKLYRVCNDGMSQFTGGYWTRTKPNNLNEVIGGTAVQPEWNSFNNLVEYTVPEGGIWVWRGNAASQKLSNKFDILNPHLAGGAEQILIPLKYRRLKKSDGSFDFGAVNPAFSSQVRTLQDNQIPWKTN